VKLPKVLAINGVSIGLTKEDVRLDAANPGRANFTVQSVEALKGRVTLDVGYKDRTLQRRFIGYVQRCTAANAVLRVLFCRELAAVLTNSQPLNLRHVDLRTVLAQVREQAGLRFHVPDRPYASMKAPYFYSLVAACQATDSLARVFSIPDFTWYPLGNGKVFVGRWGDSFDGVAALAGLRSGATINHGERITRVTSMTRWPSDGRCNRRTGERQFPELAGGYLLSRFARIVAVAGAPADAGICGDVRPRYAVDFVVLGADDEPDPALLPLTGVALPLPTGGEKMGFYAFPAEGTRVVVCFAYGLPNTPCIQASLPRVPKGDQLGQHSEAAQRRVDANGNALRQTDGQIQDKAIGARWKFWTIPKAFSITPGRWPTLRPSPCKRQNDRGTGRAQAAVGGIGQPGGGGRSAPGHRTGSE